MLQLFIFLLISYADAARPAAQGCTTTFFVTSCGDKPVEDASITLYTTYRKKVTGKTNKEGKVEFKFCLLNFDIPGEPMLYLSSGDSAYVYQAYQEGKVRRMFDEEEIERRSSYLRYSTFFGNEMQWVGDSIILYKVGSPNGIVKMDMTYQSNRLTRFGIGRVRTKMKLSKRAIKGFLGGKCYLEGDELICPINICS